MGNSIPRVMVLIETSRAFGRDFITGINEYVRKNGPWIFYTEPRGLKFTERDIKDWEVDGIITRNTPLRNKLYKLNVPVINVLHYSTPEEKVPVVKTDAALISKLAATHLLGLGYRNFGYCGFSNLDWSRERQKCFKELIERASYKVESYSEPSPGEYKDWKKELSKMAEWLKGLRKPVGIMACNDDRGHHALEACKFAGLRVPEDVAILGVDNDTLICEMSDPPLSSIALNTIKAGYETAALLDKLISKQITKINEIIVAPTHVINRQSTDIFAIDDENIVKALLYISRNVRRKINVTEIVNSTSLSRRSLETRFKNILGRSIMEEVRRMRIELISQLLIDTDLSISEICNSFNFIELDHIARYFKKETGVALREFRKKMKNS